MRKSSGDPDEDPNRQRFSKTTRSVTRALRTAAFFLLQVVVVAGIRKPLAPSLPYCGSTIEVRRIECVVNWEWLWESLD
ncbi:MAG: hypothetical protein ACO363_08200 [Balneolaceae bacterium]